MATLIQDIKTPNWQMSPYDFGEVLTDEDDIKQCIHHILFTRQGDVPFNPTFGTKIWKYVDSPQNKVAPKIVFEITSGIGLFEPRVKLTSVSTSYDTNGGVVFNINMKVVASANDLIISFDFASLKLQAA